MKVFLTASALRSELSSKTDPFVKLFNSDINGVFLHSILLVEATEDILKKESEEAVEDITYLKERQNVQGLRLSSRVRNVVSTFTEIHDEITGEDLEISYFANKYRKRQDKICIVFPTLREKKNFQEKLRSNSSQLLGALQEMARVDPSNDSNLPFQDTEIEDIQSTSVLTLRELTLSAKLHSFTAKFSNLLNSLINYFNSISNSISEKLPSWGKLAIWALLAAILALSASIVWQKLTTSSNEVVPADYFSRGEQILFEAETSSLNPDCRLAFQRKREGVKEFSLGIRINPSQIERNEHFQKAFQLFENARERFEKARGTDCAGGDAETIVYLNNSRALLRGNPLTVAVAIPVGGGTEGDAVSKELVRGVASELDRINTARGVNEKLFQVLLVKDVQDDINDTETVNRVARYIVQNNFPGNDSAQEEILAVIGHYTSDTTRIGGDIYGQSGLLLISPTSTATRASEGKSTDRSRVYFDKHVFRLSPPDSVAALRLSEAIKNIIGNRNQGTLIIFESRSEYSRAFKLEIENALDALGIRHELTCDLSEKNVDDCLSLAKVDGKILILAGTENSIDIVKENYEQSGGLKIVSGDALYNSDLLMMGRAAEGIILSVPWHIDLAPSDFKTNSKKFWGTQDVGWRSAMSADAFRTITEGVKKLEESREKSISRQKLYEAVKDTTVDGITGIIKFDQGERDLKVTDKLGVLVVVQASEGKYEFKLRPNTKQPLIE